MKKLLIYLKDYKKETILGPLFKLLEASFELLVPLVVTAIIDVGISNQDKSYIVKMCLLMVCLGIVGLISSVTAQYFAAKAAVGFSKQLRSALFAHIQGFSYSDLDTLGTSTMITRMTSDINQVQSGVNLVLRLFLRSPFVVFGAMIMAFTIDVKAALVFVVAIPLLSIVVFGIMLVTMPLYKKVQARLDRVLLMTKENLTGARVLRAFHKEDEEIDKFEEANTALTALSKFVGKISAVMNPLTYIIINGSIIALLWTGAIRVDGGILTQGAVIALVNYMSQILVELIKLANLIINISKSMASANRISAVFDIPSSPLAPIEGSKMEEPLAIPPVAVPLLSFDHVSLSYKESAEETLSDLSFTVQPGQTIGIIGGTGSGKTSLINLISGFYPASKGQIKLYGKDLAQYADQTLRGLIGLVPQKAVLFHGTIRENLQWGKEDATKEELLQALTISQSLEFVQQKEDGMDTMIAQGGKNLSGGQKQRLTIARALVKSPKILILDDSASALDYATDAKLRKAIHENLDDLTVFIVSQRASSLLYADKIIVLDDGVAADIGTHEELLKRCLVYQEIYYSQFPKEEA